MPPAPAPAPAARERLLVTGAAGRIGRILLPALGDRYEVRATDRDPGEHAGTPIRPLEVTDPDELDAAVRGCDRVLHLAATHLGHREQMGEAEYAASTVATNVAAVIELLAAAVRHEVRRVVLMSSLTVHLGEPRRERFPADTPVRPNSLYACTKLFAEQLAELHHRRDGLSTVCARLGQPYPTPPWYGLEAMAKPFDRAFAATDRDVVAGTLAALSTPVGYGVFNLVSASDEPLIDLGAGRRLGYEPRTLMTARGPVDRAAP